jgi:NitT/TauT family transport system substrate-binding protein
MKRTTRLAAVFLVSLFAFAQGSAPRTVRLGALKGPTGIGMIQLFENPPRLSQGDSLALEAIPSADVMAAKLVSGELDAAVLPVNLAAKLHAAGLSYRMVAVVGMGMVSVVTTDPALRSFEDLRGRETYVAGQGATPEYVLRAIAKKKGLDPDRDLTLAFQMPPPEIAASLITGRITVAVLPEPFATQALKGNAQARVPFSLDTLWKEATGRPGYPMSVFVMRDALLKERPDSAKAITKAYEASVAWVKTHPAEAGVLVEKHDLGMKAAIASAAIPRSAYVFVPAPAARADVEALLTVFLSLAPKSIGGKLPAGAFYAETPR